MKLLYFFDDCIKPKMMVGKKYCNPHNTSIINAHLSCIREYDVNFWFYTKEGTTIAFDSGHLNYKKIDEEFKTIKINLNNIKHIFLTHADVDHAGGIDICGTNIFPNAQVYLGKHEEQYINNKMFRMKKAGIKIKNCVKIADGYKLVDDGQIFEIDGIKIEAIHVPGHTLGHMCYLVDDRVLITGDSLAVNANGGYSFFDFFTQFPDMNKKSLKKLKDNMANKTLDEVCTGHSGLVTNIDKLFSHIDESAVFSKKNPFDKNAPIDVFK